SRILPTPSSADKPLLPPSIIPFDLFPFFRRQRGSQFRSRPHRSESRLASEIVHTIGVGQRPRPIATVYRILHPLRAVTLWPAFVERDTVLQVRRMPGRQAILGDTCTH